MRLGGYVLSLPAPPAPENGIIEGMRILLTSSRAPVTLHLIRVLAQAGHTVYATDTFTPTLGSHSRYLKRHYTTPPPRYAPAAFAAALLRIIRSHQIEMLIPTSEEIFYIARYHELLGAATYVYSEPLHVLNGWHHKAFFQRRAATLGLPTPRSVLLHSRADLEASLPDFPRYLLKPVYSRFGTRIITNTAPQRTSEALAACQPSVQDPWILQEYVSGEPLCSYSTLHYGRITAHCAYTIPHRYGNSSSGTAFVSVDGEETFAIVQKLGAAIQFTGQLSFDYIRTAEGQLLLLECNPRATSGLHLIAPHYLVGGLLNPHQAAWIEPAGQQAQLAPLVILGSLGYLRRNLLRPRGWHAAWRTLAEARRVPDIIYSRTDRRPALMQLLVWRRFARRARQFNLSLLQATTDEIEWNGL